MTPDARERFLRAIAEQIPAERIAEVHLFPPLRQGGRETGVAVVAVFPEETYVQGELPPPVGWPAGEEGTGAVANDADVGIDAGPPPEIQDAAVGTDESNPSTADDIEAARADPRAGAPPRSDDAPLGAGESHPLAAERIEHAHETHAPGTHRLIIYRAAYRWTLKGADRGRWEVELRAEADAPLETVGDVVRGVHRRAGGEAEPERLGGDEVRAAISDRPWAAPR